jgi:hypothetical protein
MNLAQAVSEQFDMGTFIDLCNFAHSCMNPCEMENLLRNWACALEIKKHLSGCVIREKIMKRFGLTDNKDWDECFVQILMEECDLYAHFILKRKFVRIRGNMFKLRYTYAGVGVADKTWDGFIIISASKDWTWCRNDANEKDFAMEFRSILQYFEDEVDIAYLLSEVFENFVFHLTFVMNRGYERNKKLFLLQ